MTTIKLHSQPGIDFVIVRAGGKNTRVQPKDGGETLLVPNDDIIEGSKEELKPLPSYERPPDINRPQLSIGQRVLRPSSSPEHEYQHVVGTVSAIQGSLVEINHRTIIHESYVRELPTDSTAQYTEDADPIFPLVDDTDPFEPIKYHRQIRS